MTASAGLLLARHRTQVSAACKGKPEALLSLVASAEPKKRDTGKRTDGVVTPIASNG